MAYPQITPEIVAQFVNKTLTEFANAYFGAIADMNQRLAAATTAVTGAGYAVGRGQQIYQPRPRQPDVQFLVSRPTQTSPTGKEYMKIKGRLSPAPNARAGLSVMLFPSDYGPEFSASMITYGFQRQQQQGIRMNVKKEDITFLPDGSVALRLRFYPDKTLLPSAQDWISRAQLPPVGTQVTPPAAAPMTQPGNPECFGFYASTEPECQACAAAGPCSAQTAASVGV